jgi:hypothetical protein
VQRPRVIWSALLAAVLAAAVDGIYLAIIASEGEGQLTSLAVLVIAAALGAAALALGVAARPAPFRFPLLVGSAAVLAVLTVLGAASIGVLLLPAAVLAWIAVVRARSPA